jgi:hypothetical protein
LADSELAVPPPLTTPPAVPKSKDSPKTSKSPSSKKLKSSSLTSSQVSSLNKSASAGALPPPISTPPPPPIVPIAKEKKTKVKSRLSEKLKARPKRDELVAKGLLQADAYAESARPPAGALPPPLAAVSPSTPKREKKVSNKK